MVAATVPLPKSSTESAADGGSRPESVGVRLVPPVPEAARTAKSGSAGSRCTTELGFGRQPLFVALSRTAPDGRR